MSFTHIKKPELDFELEAKTTESGRVYFTPSGKAYPSVTTVLGSLSKEGIKLWREKVGEEEANKISGRASRRGEALHLACEKYLLNEMDFKMRQQMMPDTKSLFLQLKPHLDESLGNIYAIEQPLYSDNLRIAGRVDCIAEWDNELAVIDFKTSKRVKTKEDIDSYFAQCVAYAMMYEELVGEPIDQIVIIISTDGLNEPQVFIKSKMDYIDKLFEKILKFHGEMKGK